jgi:hypothetical protein
MSPSQTSLRLHLVHPLLGTLLISAPLAASGDAPAPPVLDAARRAAVADSIAGLVAARYPDEVLGRRLADSLRTWGRADAWRRDSSHAAFAASLERDMRRVVPDEHLWTRWEPGVEYVRGPQMRMVSRGAPGAGPGSPGAGGPLVRRTMRVDSRDSLGIARTNFGFTRVEMLDGNVGYLKLDRFVPRDLAEPTAVTSMAAIADARAVVLDLRDNPGGSPDLVTLLMSFFLDETPRLIHASYWRADDLDVLRRRGNHAVLARTEGPDGSGMGRRRRDTRHDRARGTGAGTRTHRRSVAPVSGGCRNAVSEARA